MGDSPATRIPYEPFNADYTSELVQQVIQPIVEHYFRPVLLGADRLPKTGPLIVASNHSGNSFPFDAIVLDSLMWLKDGLRPERKLRSMFVPELALRWWMRPFGVDNLWRTVGGVDQTFDNFERLIVRGDRVGYYPEGVPGIGKGFRRRYQLQPFHSSFVSIAARHRVPVYPVSIVNAEWSLPFSFTLAPLNWVMQKLFHVPFLPLPAAPLGITFPWTWWLSLPARMIFVIGEPIDVRALAEAEGVTDFERPDLDKMRRVADKVRSGMQRELDRHVRRHGRWPYQWRSLWRALGKARRRGLLAGVLPTGWPARFVRFHRDRNRPAARSRLHAVLRDWDLLGFYLPFGWPLLSLTRAFRRSPCGHRGVGYAERDEREGNFVWRLRERPLPPRSDSATRRASAEASPPDASAYGQARRQPASRH